MEEDFSELFDTVNGMIDDGQPDAAIRDELGNEVDSEILDDLIHEIRSQ
jgi:hypothetical protein